MTSVSTRPDAAAPRRRGDPVALALPAAGCFAVAPVDVGGFMAMVVDGRAHRLARRRPAGPALERRCALCDQDLQTVDHARPSSSALRRGARAAGPVDHVHDAGFRHPSYRPRSAGALNGASPGAEADGGAVDDDLGAPGPLHRRGRRGRRRAARPARGVRFQTATSAPARAQRPGRGPRRAARAEHERAAPGRVDSRAPRAGPARRCCRRGSAPASKVSVFAAPTARRGHRRGVGERQRGLLVRDRHVERRGSRPPGARARSPRTARAAAAAAGSASRRARRRRARRCASAASASAPTGQPPTPR